MKTVDLVVMAHQYRWHLPKIMRCGFCGKESDSADFVVSEETIGSIHVFFHRTCVVEER